MKIKLLLISIFTSLAFALSAQDEHEYIPFVRDCEFGYYGYYWGDITGFVHYWIEGEFRLEGKTYKGFYSDASGEKKLIGYVREENRQVYFRDEEREWRWYDFSLEVDDIFCIEEGSPMMWEPFETEACGPQVQRIETSDIYGKARKSVMLDWGYWVEGVGDDECLPFDTFAPRPTSPCGHRLFYIKENDQFVYRQTTHWGDEVPIEDPFLEGKYTYVPLVREGIEWGYNGDYGHYRYQIKGDSVVNGVHYKKMYKYTTDAIQEDSPLRGLVREEGRKVYARGYHSSVDIEVEDKEYLIYDFTAQVGDEVTLQSDYGFFGSKDWWTVDRIDTIQVGNQLRRKLSVMFNEHIEGIGGIHHDWFVPLFDLATCTPDCNLYQRLDYVKNLETGEYEYGGGYTPFVRDCEFGYYRYDWEEVTGFIHYWIEGEFAISGKTYKGYYSDINGTKELLGYVREEDRKVYFRDVDNSWPWIEWLWYDFTLKKGDKFIVEEGSPFQWNDQNIGEVSVHEAWPLDIANQSRKCIDFNNGLFYWVEGMGDLYCLPFETFDEQVDCICGHKLFYIKEGGEFVYYDMRHQVGDYITNTPVEDPYLSVNGAKTLSLQIAYHPEQIVVTLPSRGYCFAEVMDSIGRVTWCESLDGEADEVIIPTTHLSRGIYIVSLTSQSGKRVTCKVVK